MSGSARRGLLLALLLAASPASADWLTATTLEDGNEIARVSMPVGSEWCIAWHHSVQGFQVSDCYRNLEGRMVLVRSHQPDFAAGLGHLPGRGRQRSDGAGGYVIDDINEAVPGNAYVLRPGMKPVDHRIIAGDTVISLSALAPRARVRIALLSGHPNEH